MPIRTATREQAWLLPPTLDELIGAEHPVRFVALFVEALPEGEWQALGINRWGAERGAPASAPAALLSVWLYGFMTGVRASRTREGACRERLPFLWLSGCQQPDHNTLWRFDEAHRTQMRRLLRRTVRTAVGAGLVDLAVQAVDGTNVLANAAKDRTYDAKGLAKLLSKTEAAIADLEAQNATGGDPPPATLPAVLQRQQALRDQVVRALTAVLAAEAEALSRAPAPPCGAGTAPAPGAGTVRVNLTDGDATLMKGRQGIVAGSNAQAMVLGLDAAAAGRPGLLIGAADVVTDPDDHAQLVPLVEQAQALVGQPVAVAVTADGGDHSGANLDALAERGVVVVMAAALQDRLADPYHKDAFRHDPDADPYTCPQGQVRSFRGMKQHTGRLPVRRSRGTAAVCRACPAFGVWTKDHRHGRTLEIGPFEPRVRRHRSWMQTAVAKRLSGRRKELPEPTFGILKEQQGARRFLLRGLAAVRAEWSLLATAFNLRTLAAVWAGRLRLRGGV